MLISSLSASQTFANFISWALTARSTTSAFHSLFPSQGISIPPSKRYDRPQGSFWHLKYSRFFWSPGSFDGSFPILRLSKEIHEIIILLLKYSRCKLVYVNLCEFISQSLALVDKLPVSHVKTYRNWAIALSVLPLCLKCIWHESICCVFKRPFKLYIKKEYCGIYLFEITFELNHDWPSISQSAFCHFNLHGRP